MMKTSTPAPAAKESFAALFEESLSRKEMRIGEVITAEVVRVDDNFVFVRGGERRVGHEVRVCRPSG